MNNNIFIYFAKICIYLILIGYSTLYSAYNNSVPEVFRGVDKDSSITILYDDYSRLLSMSVMEMGRSNRAKAPDSRPEINSRIKPKRKKNTALEGNRFNFKNFKKSSK